MKLVITENPSVAVTKNRYFLEFIQNLEKGYIVENTEIKNRIAS